MTIEKIESCLKENGIPTTPDLPEKLLNYMNLLEEWNRHMDLTAVTEEDETLDKHFIDSLTVLKNGFSGDGKTLIDVGTGAGFPGMVLAIACPKMQVTLLDAQQKRLTFLQAVAEALQLSNVTLVHARAEDGARKPELREKFDFAVARAVAPLNVLCEYLLPYVRLGGEMLCWKGPGIREELELGKRAAFLLGGKTGELIECPIAGRDWQHMILEVHKVSTTPKQYPRKAGTPKNKPLGL